MLVLGIDTSVHELSGVAIFSKDGLVSEYSFSSPMKLGEKLVPAIKLVMEQAGLGLADLSGICVSKGPGSFTGLRIGVVTAKTLAYTLSIPLVGVISLDAIAYNFRFMGGGTIICPMVNCRRGEVYSGVYKVGDGGGLESVSGIVVIEVGELLNQLRDMEGEMVLAGDALNLYEDELQAESGMIFAPAGLRLPKASVVAEMGLKELEAGRQEDPLLFKPVYLRYSQAEERLKIFID